MSTVDPTKPPPQPVPQKTPEQVLQEFYQAKAARDWWENEERRLRLLLADMYCVDAQTGNYKSRTLDLGGGHKLVFSVTRNLKVATQDPHYQAWHKTANPTLINTLFKTKPAKLEPSVTGYNSLPDDVKAAIAPAISFTESVSASFEAPKDER